MTSLDKTLKESLDVIRNCLPSESSTPSDRVEEAIYALMEVQDSLAPSDLELIETASIKYRII